MASTITQVRFLKDSAGVGGPTVQSGNLEQLLPVFSGEVLLAYNRHRLFSGMVQTYTINSGIHMDFPILGKISSQIHEAGEELLGMDVDTMRRRITLDDRPIVSHMYLDDIDEMLSHFQARASLSNEMGIRLAEDVDEAIARLVILASRSEATPVGPDWPGGGGSDGTNGSSEFGTTVSNATGSPKAYVSTDFNKINSGAGTAETAHLEALLKAINDVNVKFDKNNIPVTGRFCAIDPEAWHGLRDMASYDASIVTNTTGQPFMSTPGGSNPAWTVNPAMTESLMYKGTQIYRTNAIPKVNASSDRFRAGDYRGTVGMIWQSNGVGFLQKFGVMTEQERKATRGADFLVSKTMIGGGTLRPECCVELSVADAAAAYSS